MVGGGIGTPKKGLTDIRGRTHGSLSEVEAVEVNNKLPSDNVFKKLAYSISGEDSYQPVEKNISPRTKTIKGWGKKVYDKVVGSPTTHTGQDTTPKKGGYYDSQTKNVELRGISMDEKSKSLKRGVSNSSSVATEIGSSSTCSICNKNPKSAAGGICGRCWTQIKEKGVKIGNLEDFKQFTSSISDQVSRIVAVDADGLPGSAKQKKPDGDSIMKSLQNIIPDIFDEGETTKRPDHDNKETVVYKEKELSTGKAIEFVKDKVESSEQKSKTSSLPTGKERTITLTKSKTFALPDKKNSSKFVFDKLHTNDEKIKTDLKGLSTTALDTSKVKVTRANTEWNMKSEFSKMLEKQVPLKQSEQNTAKIEEQRKDKSKTGISLTAQKKAKDRAVLKREKTINIKECAPLKKERYEPTTIKESKDLLEKKKAFGASRSADSSLTNLNMKRNHTTGLTDRSKSNSRKTLIRRKSTPLSSRRSTTMSDSQVNKIGKIGELLSQIKEASSDEEDDLDDINKREVLSSFTAKDKLMVKGQNSSKPMEIEESKPVIAAPTITDVDMKPVQAPVQSEPVNSMAGLSTFERLKKYGKYGDGENQFLNTCKTENRNVAVGSVEKPSFSTQPKQLTQASLPKETIKHEDSDYFGGIGPQSKKPKSISYTEYNEDVVECENSIYHEVSRPLKSICETVEESSDYTSDQNKPCIKPRNLQNMPIRTAMGLAVCRDLAFGAGESPLLGRKPFSSRGNFVDSSNIYHMSKQFAPGKSKGELLGSAPLNKYISYHRDLNPNETMQKDSTSDCYTGDIYRRPGLPEEPSHNNEIKSITHIEPKNNDYFDNGSSYCAPQNEVSYSICKKDSSPTASQNQPASTTPADNLYTGGLFKAYRPQPSLPVSKAILPTFCDEVNSTDKPNNASLGSSVDEGSNNSLRKITRRNRQNKQAVEFIERSIDTAGDFFSKTLMNFRPTMVNTNNNSGNDTWFDETTGPKPVPNRGFNQDKLKFAIAKTEDAEYTDWRPGFEPELKKSEVKIAEKESIAVDFSNRYEKYESGIFEKVKQPKPIEICTDGWYAGTEDDFIGPMNVTWDGREWPGSKSSRKPPPETEEEPYEMCLPCEKYNENNNAPDYSKYVRKAEKKDEAPPKKWGNETDYTPCLFSFFPAQVNRRRTTIDGEEKPKPVVHKGQYFSSYLSPKPLNAPPSSYTDHEPVEHAGFDEHVYEQKVEKLDKAPSVPKITHVGAIKVRNNVENDFDYAENINRDIGAPDAPHLDVGESSDDYSSKIFPEHTSSIRFPEETSSLIKSMSQVLPANTPCKGYSVDTFESSQVPPEKLSLKNHRKTNTTQNREKTPKREEKTPRRVEKTPKRDEKYRKPELSRSAQKVSSSKNKNKSVKKERSLPMDRSPLWGDEKTITTKPRDTKYTRNSRV